MLNLAARHVFAAGKKANHVHKTNKKEENSEKDKKKKQSRISNRETKREASDAATHTHTHTAIAIMVAENSPLRGRHTRSHNCLLPSAALHHWPPVPALHLSGGSSESKGEPSSAHPDHITQGSVLWCGLR